MLNFFQGQFTNNLTKLFVWLNIPFVFILPLIWKQKRTTTKIIKIKDLNNQLIIWNICMQIPFSLLSISHEALFLSLFSTLLFVYFQLESGEKIQKLFLIFDFRCFCFDFRNFR